MLKPVRSASLFVIDGIVCLNLSPTAAALDLLAALPPQAARGLLYLMRSDFNKPKEP
jgi:hypothetical protein